MVRRPGARPETKQPNMSPGTVLDGELIVVGARGGITDTAAAEIPGRRDNWTTRLHSYRAATA
jgi:hypothetical protein